ncbi:hypothetical protein [Paenibacillus amylolyticus]|uniref:hypothetical protein n=1 Tax=Paenibacillus amylolyticus TaxID=1451 RepID=UPI003D95BCEA
MFKKAKENKLRVPTSGTKFRSEGPSGHIGPIEPSNEVSALIKKAVSDEVFKNSLAKDFDKTIKEHNITLNPTEKAALAIVDWSQNIPTKIEQLSGNAWVHIYK